MQQGRTIPRTSFKFDPEYLDEPSEFQIIFIHNDTKYLYGFSVTEEEVVEEYLYYYPNGRQSTIFERNRDEYKFTIDIERQTELKNKFHSKNKLFIATESLWEYEKAKVPFEWLSSYLNIFINHDRLENYTGKNMKEDENINLLVKKYIKLVDVGIDDILNSGLLKLLSDDAKADVLKTLQDGNALEHGENH